MKSLNGKRKSSNTVEWKGKLYVVGGQSDKRLSTVERYDVATDEWTNLANLNTPRSGHRCCVIQGAIYAIGGFNGSKCLDSIEKYDEKNNQWTVVREFYFLFLIAQELNIYTCLLFNFQIDTTLDVPRTHFGAYAVGDWLHIVGGWMDCGGRKQISGDFLRINIRNGHVEKLDPIPKARHSVKCALVH